VERFGVRQAVHPWHCGQVMVESPQYEVHDGSLMMKRDAALITTGPARHEASTVAQSNQLMEASYTLTLPEKQLVLLAAAELDAHGTMNSDGIVGVTAAKLAKAFDIPLNHAYGTLKSAAESLFERTIRSIRKSRKGRDIVRNARWISAKEYEDGEGKLTLTFSTDVIPFLTNLRKQFTTLELRYVGRLPTFYAVRLYELFTTARSSGSAEYSVEELRDLLNITTEYSAFRDFRRHVVDPSVLAINEKTDLRVVADYRSVGRKVVAIAFTIGKH